MIPMEVGDDHDVDACVAFGLDRLDLAIEEGEMRAEHRIGQDPEPAELEDCRRMAKEVEVLAELHTGHYPGGA